MFLEYRFDKRESSCQASTRHKFHRPNQRFGVSLIFQEACPRRSRQCKYIGTMKGIVPYDIPPALAMLEKHKRKSTASAVLNPGGEGEIRTLEPFLAVTRFPVVRARPTTRLLHVLSFCRFPTSLLSYHKDMCLSRTFLKKVEI